MAAIRPRVVLYNPRAPYFTMPLALIALGSAMDRSRFDVRIIDGRLQADQIAAVVEATIDAVCLGISVLTGVPIRDALAVTQAVKRANPRCRIVWGGWHPSLFPAETLRDSGADAVVVGQGEDTFAEILEHVVGGLPLDHIPGCLSRDDERRLFRSKRRWPNASGRRWQHEIR